MKFMKYFTVHEDRMEHTVSLVKVINSLEEVKQLVQKEVVRPKILNGCYMVVDKDGDFVDACSSRMPANSLDSVIQRVMQSHPDNAPFRVIKWNGFEFVEVTAVS